MKYLDWTDMGGCLNGQRPAVLKWIQTRANKGYERRRTEFSKALGRWQRHKKQNGCTLQRKLQLRMVFCTGSHPPVSALATTHHATRTKHSKP